MKTTTLVLYNQLMVGWCLFGVSPAALAEMNVFEQPPGATHVAFEAETPKATFVNDPREIWTRTNLIAASGGAAIIAVGENVTASPVSFVDYQIRFTTAGAYRLYSRWRAHEVPAAADRFTANSFHVPLQFNTGTELAEYAVSASNTGTDAQGTPSSTNFTVIVEAQTYDVTQAMVDSGEVVLLRLGTRERGIILDRIALSTDQGLDEAGFNALANTDADSTPPMLLNASGSETLSEVTVTLSEAINAGTFDAFNITLSDGLTVITALLDPVGLKTVFITTSAQTPGSSYRVTINGIADLSGNVIAPDSSVAFTAWRLAPGWATRRVYTAITGGTVSDLVNSPKYPDSPDSTDVFRGLVMENNPAGANYGLRIRCFFIPPATGLYEFFMYADDQAELSLSLTEASDGLMTLLTSPYATNDYHPDIKGGFIFDELTGGQRYLLQVLVKQGTGVMRLGVAARQVILPGEGEPGLEGLMPLIGNLIATYVNPDTATALFTKQPQDTNVTVGFRARFEAEATSPGGAVTYQWQVNGADIPGASRPVYITPPLALTDSGKNYRVIAIAAGAEEPSNEATVTVSPGEPPTEQPFIGVNFVGDSDGFLAPTDVAGVVYQANFNNIEGGTASGAPLVDADGNPTPVTLSFSGAIRYTGAGTRTADDALFTGYVQNNNTPMSVALNGVPSGNYGLIVYSVGFPFQTIYDQAFSLIGGATYPTYHIRAQDGLEYVNDRRYIRMASTDPNARDHGNYVVFENISPDASDTLMLDLTPEPPATPGVTDAMPALNALQLVQLRPAQPRLNIVRNENNAVTLSWAEGATGYVLESTSTLGSTASWSVVDAAPNPIGGAGSVSVNAANGSAFFRLRQ